MPATFYQLKLADGRVVCAPIHGSGGLVGDGDHNFRRVEAAIAQANKGRPTGLYEPRPGFARTYPNYTAADSGEPLDVDLRGAQVIASTSTESISVTRKGA